jgi:DNA-binding transcriptional LysR family regulator
LVRHAGTLLAGMEAAQVAIEQVNGEARGQLTMTVYESVATTLLPPLLIQLARTHPDLHIRTRQADPDQAIEALVMGDIDLAFTIDYAHATSAIAPPRSADYSDLR